MRSAQVHPYLNLTKAVARREPAYVRVDKKQGVVGNGFLEARIYSDKKNREQGVFVNKISGEEFELEFRPFQARFDYGKVSGREAVCQRLEARGSKDCASLISFFSFEHFDLEISYRSPGMPLHPEVPRLPQCAQAGSPRAHRPVYAASLFPLRHCSP